MTSLETEHTGNIQEPSHSFQTYQDREYCKKDKSKVQKDFLTTEVCIANA